MISITEENVTKTGEKTVHCSESFKVINQSGANKPYISIVIVAHNHREFLKEALRSALNQTLDRSLFEVVVVKNYLNSELDEYIAKNDVTSVLEGDDNVGRSLYRGIINSKGKVISFLDYDDLFLDWKLSHIYEMFQSDNTIQYYHNSYESFDENGVVLNGNRRISTKIEYINSDVISKSSFFALKKCLTDRNLSSITIKKEIIWDFIEELKVIVSNTDDFFFYVALNSGGSILSENLVLTRYRIHESTSRDMSDLESFIKKKLDHSKLSITTFDIIVQMSRSDLSKKMASCALNHWISYAKIIENSTPGFADLLRCREIGSIKLILAFVIKKISTYAFLRIFFRFEEYRNKS